MSLKDLLKEQGIDISRSRAEEILEYHFRIEKLEEGLIKEFEFAKSAGRKFRADFAYPKLMILIEVEGVKWNDVTRHTFKSGYENDCRKYNLAAKLGYRVLRYTGSMIESGEAIQDIKEFMKEHQK